MAALFVLFHALTRRRKGSQCACGSLQPVVRAGVGVRFGSCQRYPDVRAAPPEAPAAPRPAGPALRRLTALLQRLTAAAARRPRPKHLRGLLSRQTRTPGGPIVPRPAQRRPEPAVRQCRHEPGECGTRPACSSPEEQRSERVCCGL